MLPFSRQAFCAVFASYNTTVWPAQVFLYGLAATLVALALRGRSGAHRLIPVGLGLLWVWAGVLYHWGHFTAINPAAWVFGALFVIQGVLFVGHGIGGRWVEIGRPRDRRALGRDWSATGSAGAGSRLAGLAAGTAGPAVCW